MIYDEITKEKAMIHEDITNELRREQYEIRWMIQRRNNEGEITDMKETNTKELLIEATRAWEDVFLIITLTCQPVTVTSDERKF